MSEPLGPSSPGKAATSHSLVSDSVSISTQTVRAITVLGDFRRLVRLCRLGNFTRYFRLLAILRSCAWRIRTDRYKLHILLPKTLLVEPEPPPMVLPPPRFDDRRNDTRRGRRYGREGQPSRSHRRQQRTKVNKVDLTGQLNRLPDRPVVIDLTSLPAMKPPCDIASSVCQLEDVLGTVHQTNISRDASKAYHEDRRAAPGLRGRRRCSFSALGNLTK